MKTLRMSRSAENRNARKDMAIRGRAGASRATLLAPDQVLSGRRFRRANKLTHEEAAALETLSRGPETALARQVHTVTIDQLSRMIMGWQLG